MIIDDKMLSLEERVFLTLEDEILSGKLAFGSSLGEIALSERLGVSRTPVRAALVRLAEDGLIRSVPNKGSVVMGISKEDLIDIYEIRIRLEGLASRTAAGRISEKGLRALCESVELAEFYISKKDTERLRELDSEFHETIYGETGNRLLCKTLSELHRKIKSYRKISISSEERLIKSVCEHREIYEAIAAGDAELADRLTSSHIEEALANLLRLLGQKG